MNNLFKKTTSKIALWCDKHLGWHKCEIEGNDGASNYGICKYCGAKCLQDSQGNWFKLERNKKGIKKKPKMAMAYMKIVNLSKGYIIFNFINHKVKFRRKKMDDFKRKNMKEADSWDWNCPKVCKRQKGDTQRLHKLSRKRLKDELKKEDKSC